MYGSAFINVNFMLIHYIKLMLKILVDADTKKIQVLLF